MNDAAARYTVEALVGRGGMAEVYRAVVHGGPRDGQVVALKRLRPDLATDPEQVTLFEREAVMTRRLHHPAIVDVFDTGRAGGTPFIVMEYVDGRNLRAILAQCAARGILLPVDFAAYVAHVVAGALAHAHGGTDAEGRPLGIVHCDVSPSNVFVSRRGEIRLGDFGVALPPGARAAGDGAAGAFGKVRYLAPEVLRGERPGPPGDLFALGACLFELLAGRPAFEGETADEVGRRILQGERPSPGAVRAGVPPALEALAFACLAPDPAARPTAAGFAAQIAGAYDRTVGTPLAIAAVVQGLFGKR